MIFGTVAVCCAFVFSGTLATKSIVRIARKSWQTFTMSDVVLSNTLRVRSTGVTVADGQALENSKNVLSTGGV